MLVVRQVGIKGTHGDGALLVNLVDGASQEVDDLVVELDFTNLGLQHFERLPCGPRRRACPTSVPTPSMWYVAVFHLYSLSLIDVIVVVAHVLNFCFQQQGSYAGAGAKASSVRALQKAYTVFCDLKQYPEVLKYPSPSNLMCVGFVSCLFFVCSHLTHVGFESAFF